MSNVTFEMSLCMEKMKLQEEVAFLRKRVKELETAVDKKIGGPEVKRLTVSSILHPYSFAYPHEKEQMTKDACMRMAQNLAPYVRMVHRAPSFLGLSTASLSPSLFDTENYEFILDVVVPPKW